MDFRTTKYQKLTSCYKIDMVAIFEWIAVHKNPLEYFTLCVAASAHVDTNVALLIIDTLYNVAFVFLITVRTYGIEMSGWLF